MKMQLNETKLIKKQPPQVEVLLRRGYTLGKTLGKGSYGNVIYAHHKDPETGKETQLACKFINQRKVRAKDITEHFLPRELETLKKIHHPNIVRVHGIFKVGPQLFIFMNLAQYGDLLDYIKTFGKCHEMQANLWFFQLVSAIRYLHSLNIAHRDLKCENLLISNHLNIKLADFGFSRETIDQLGQDIYSTTYCGSHAYAPPEIVNGIPYLPKKADVWSCGVVLMVMLYGSLPFDDSNMPKLRAAQKSRKYLVDEKITQMLSKECKQVIYNCLTPEMDKRPFIEDIYKSPWLDNRLKEIERKSNVI